MTRPDHNLVCTDADADGAMLAATLERLAIARGAVTPETPASLVGTLHTVGILVDGWATLTHGERQDLHAQAGELIRQLAHGSTTSPHQRTAPGLAGGCS